MVSFYNMCQLLEVAKERHRTAVVHQRKLDYKRMLENRQRLARFRTQLIEADEERSARTSEQQKLARARQIARIKVLAGNRPPDPETKPEEYASYQAAVEDQAKEILNFMNKGGDEMEFLGGVRGASQRLARASKAGSDNTIGISQRDIELNRADRKPRDDSVVLPKGQADARQIYHAVTHNPEVFTSRNWSFQDLLMKIIEMGIIPAEEPERFEKAMEWLTNGAEPLFFVKNNTLEVNPNKVKDKKIGSIAYARASNAREGDYIPDMARPGERYTRGRDKLKVSYMKPGEMPPIIRQQVDKIRQGISEIHDMFDVAKIHQFADLDTFSKKLEDVMSQFRNVAKEKLLPSTVKQEIVRDLTNIRTAMDTEIKPLFDQPNPLRDARYAMRQVHIAMAPVEPDIGQTDDALKAAAKAIEDLKAHPTASSHPETAKQIEDMAAKLASLKASWERQMNPPKPTPPPEPAPAPAPIAPPATTKPPAAKKPSGNKSRNRFTGRTVNPPVERNTDNLF